MLRFVCALSLSVFALLAAPATASTVGFSCITGGPDCAIGEAQLEIAFTDQAPGVIAVVVRNAGPAASLISEVFFSDSAHLVAVSSVTDNPVISYEIGVDPAGLFGSSGIVWHLGVTGRPERMAGPGQELTIVLDVVGLTAAGLEELIRHGEIVVGVRVVDFSSGGAESFVSGPVNVPEPGVALLLVAGALAARRRARA